MAKTQGKSTKNKVVKKKPVALLSESNHKTNQQKNTISRCIEICELIKKGYSLRSALLNKRMHADTFYIWINNDSKNQERYARACELRADAMFDEIIEIADTPMIGQKVKQLPDGRQVVESGDMIEHRKLQIEARKWSLSKMNPKKYSEKLEVDQKTNVKIKFT